MLALLLSHSLCMHPRPQKRRRTATSVMAGNFDPVPQRDVLTSLLNGVGPNKDVEAEEEARRLKKKKDSRKDKRHDSSARRDSHVDAPPPSDAPWVAPSSSTPAPSLPIPQPKKKKTFWSAHSQRPNIQIMTMERSVSVTPPPGYSPVNVPSASPTPGPSCSSTTSRTSSKRPRTPDDDGDAADIIEYGLEPTSPATTSVKMRKKRIAHKKGWKGWIEGSPQPSEKLINLDSAPVLHERRTRSGKNFDAISVGKDGWV